MKSKFKIGDLLIHRSVDMAGSISNASDIYKISYIDDNGMIYFTNGILSTFGSNYRFARPIEIMRYRINNEKPDFTEPF